MKIKSNMYGIFYKDGEKWKGPIQGDLLTEEQINLNEGPEELLRLYGRQLKKKVKIFRQFWKSV